MTAYLFWALLLIVAGLLILAFMENHRDRKKQEKLDLYRRAELIGRRRLDHEPL